MRETLFAAGSASALELPGAAAEAQGLPALIDAALEFAAYAHQGQCWKQRPQQPFLQHVIEVAELLWQIAGVRDAEWIAAALLHDTVEKTSSTAQDIQSRFGERVCAIVLELTDDMNLPRKERYRQQLDHSGQLSFAARHVKIADKTSNIRDLVENPPEHWPLERQREYCQWVGAVVERIRGVNPALEAEFDRCLEYCREKIGL